MGEKKHSAVLTTTAHFVPDRVVTNADLEKMVDTTDEWIRSRTGIGQRFFLDGEPTSFMAVDVARQLLERRQLDPREIDLIIVATITPDMMFPSTACLVQHQIGAERAWGYDLSAACSGFAFALVAAAQFIENGAHRKVMVIGADKMSSIIDFTDRSTCVLFGDGAGGVLLERADDTDQGMVDFELHVDGSGGDCLNLRGGGSLHPTTHESIDQRLHYVYQEGRTVFRFAVVKMAEVCDSLMQKNGLSGDQLKLFVPHQANLRIIDAAAERLGLRPEQVMINIDRYANTTAATIPIALSEANDKGLLEAGDNVLFAGVGGGLTWGSVLWRWGKG
ncbi:MAG: beta-ketoacyl-ACP synthase III [Candidatus Latescibacteria bacterium]|nr:beta-ketoacyl-ACP synthase III [Candidatus Latescibacterota bacterium]